MRIALFHNLPSGGAKRTLYEATRKLADRHLIDVFSLSSANHDFADLRPLVNKYQVFNFKPGSLLSSPFGRLNQLVRFMDLMRLQAVCKIIARRIAAANYDVALLHTCQFENSSSLMHWLTDLPKVYYCHEPLRIIHEMAPARPYDDSRVKRRELLNHFDPVRKLYYRTLRSRDLRNIKQADAVLVNSEFSKGSVKSIYRIDAQVSYHGVDTNLFRPQQADKQPILLSVGSLTPLKGFDFLIESLSQIPENERPRLAIASNFQNPPEKLYLRELAEKSKVGLELMDNVSDKKLVELYNQAQLVVYAPLGEPFGLVPLEAMACTTPVVAVREGGIPESVVHGQTGLLTDRDVDQFASAVSYLLAKPSLIKKYGHDSRKHVLQNWTWEQAAKRLEEHFDHVLSDQAVLMAQ